MKLLLASLFLVAQVQAATIAVIDSGLDTKHEMITPNLWFNPLEMEDRRDNDNNGYQDDVNGWNFAEQNGRLIDYKYLGTFSSDCKLFFDVQGKYFLKQATEAEIAWMKMKVADKNFLKEMGKFGNFIHGTHVAGITIHDSQNVVMGIKLIPTEVKPFFETASKSMAGDRWATLGKAFDALAAQQMALLTNIASFAASHKADVANGSFGTGFNQAKMITDKAFMVIFFRKPNEEESNRAAKLFIDTLVAHGKAMIDAAPETLFVFAAGNDGMSNDEFGSSPANIKGDNIITVGATYKDEFFAPFSNYGVKMVEVAAPGMLIKSSIPGNDYLQVSGTSQASPFVANVAAKIKNANKNLKPVEIKAILMGTVDKKAYLADKVTSGGIVNTDRAVVAAEMSQTMSVAQAINRAKMMVRSVKSASVVTPHNNDVMVMPLTPMFE